jgi:Mrp family chromosome partitioning ATPase
MSGKGGVGKSSVTVNIAAALARKGCRVGILDVDIHGPSIANLLGLGHGLEMDEHEQKLIPAEFLPNLYAVSMDSLLRNKNTAVLWRGPKKTTAIRQFLANVQWGDLDFLLIDSPPGTGDEHLTILKIIPNALCLVVTTPQEIALADVRKALNFLQHAQSAILGVVENMSGLACPYCGKDIPLFKTGGGKELAKDYAVPFLGAIALDPVTVVAADRGVPVVLLEEDSIAKKDFLALAETVATACTEDKAVRLPLLQREN